MITFKRFLKIWSALLALFLIIGMVFNMEWTEILIKNGNTCPDPEHKRHRKDYNDGQIIGIKPAGYYKGKITHKHFTILLVPGKYDAVNDLNVKKLLFAADKNGKLPWDSFYDRDGKLIRKRDWLVDLTDLLQKGVLTPAQLSSLYNKDISMGAIPINLGLFDIAKHEDHYTRKDLSRLFSPGSTSQGDKEIGFEADFDDVPSWEADLIALTGNCRGLHRDEETVVDTALDFDIATGSYKLTLTCKDGAEPGGVWGNGAKINYVGFDRIGPTGDCKDMEISKLSLDAQGSANSGISFRDYNGSGGTLEAFRLLIRGDSLSTAGIYLYQGLAGHTFNIDNNIIYGFTSSSATWSSGRGLAWHGQYASHAGTFNVYNNSVMKCRRGLSIWHASANGTHDWQNNFAQASLVADFVHQDALDTYLKNLSKDSTSPNAALRDLNKEDKVVNFTLNNFLRLGEDDHLKTGEDLNAKFTRDNNHGPGRRPVAGLWDIGASQLDRVVAAKGSSAHTHSFV